MIEASGSDQRTEEDRFPIHPDVSLHFLGREGVLFDARAQRLYALNTTGAFIWCLLEEQLPASEIAARLQSAFDMPLPQAISYVRAALTQWRKLGLDRDGTPPLTKAVQSPPPRAVQTIEDIEIDPAATLYYRLLDLDIRIRTSRYAPSEELQRFLMPLKASPESEDDALSFDLIEDDGCFAFLRNGRIVDRWLRADQVIPVVKLALLDAALEHSGDFGALHAAAICDRDNDCVLLIGPSGSGKSTLTAALMASGLRVLGDDTIVLSQDELNARPVPFGISLKAGAWYLLASYFPDLAEEPIYHRPDGTGVRYLLPPSGEIWAPPPHCPVKGALFLNRSDDAESATLTPLTPAEALRRLAAEFCPLGEGLTTAKVDRLVRWIDDVQCFELRYSSLESAVDAVRNTCT